MATSYTFARLTAPKQFRPEEDVVFKLEYSEDLVSTSATLIIDGYVDSWGGNEDVPAYNYTGTTITHIIHESKGWTWDIGYEEFTVPGGALGKTPPVAQPTGHFGGTVKARVQFTKQNGETYVSNSVVVNMLLMWDNDLIFFNTPYNITSSTFIPQLKYSQRHSLGEYDANYINSYHYYLYDSNYNLISDSGELYDWDSYIYWTDTSFSFKGLQDNQTYYVRAKVTLNGGYIFWRGYEPVYVHYADLPEESEKFKATNISTGIELNIDLAEVEHDRIVVTRSIVGQNVWLAIKDINISTNSVVIDDHYCIPDVKYQYRAVVYNGNDIVTTYYCYDTFKSSGIIISDSQGAYVAVGNLEKYPISRNDRGQEHETMDNKYPYYIINGAADYDRGSVSALFTEVDDDCSLKLDNHEYADILRAWLNNGKAKLLTYYNTGESWIVAISGVQTTDPNNTDVLSTSFNWVQIGDAHDIANYPKYGLAVSEDA